MTQKIERHGVRVDGTSVPFFTRAGSLGDVGAMNQVFASKDYRVDMWQQGRLLDKKYQQIIRIGKQPLIIDAGANIGAASLYFSVRYPECKVVAIEPDSNNCQMLRLNVAGRNVEVFQGALSSTIGHVVVTDPGLSDWGFRTSASPDAVGTLVPTVTISHILAANTSLIPLICKIDIEGAEGDVFNRSVDWIDVFPLTIVELHDWMLPFSGSSRPFIKAIASKDVDFIYRGDNAFVFSEPLLQPRHPPQAATSKSITTKTDTQTPK